MSLHIDYLNFSFIFLRLQRYQLYKLMSLHLSDYNFRFFNTDILNERMAR